MLRTRTDDWAARLRAELDRYRGRPFVRGERDCLTLWCDAVQAVTGADALAELRGRYTTLTGATRLRRRLGIAEPADYADRVFQRCPAALLQRGDLIRVGSGPLVCPGVVLGTVAATCREGEGYVLVPVDGLTDGWAV